MADLTPMQLTIMERFALLFARDKRAGKPRSAFNLLEIAEARPDVAEALRSGSLPFGEGRQSAADNIEQALNPKDASFAVLALEQVKILEKVKSDRNGFTRWRLAEELAAKL